MSVQLRSVCADQCLELTASGQDVPTKQNNNLGMESLNNELYFAMRDALAKEGLTCGLSPTEADFLLGRLIGEKRYHKFCHVMKAVRKRRRPLLDAYKMFKTVREAQVLMSAQADVVVGVNTAVAQAGALLTGRFARVAEVGCHAGGVLRFFANRMPETSFVGFDRLPELLANAQQICPGNVTLVSWNYQAQSVISHGGFDLIFGAFPIDFDGSETSGEIESVSSYGDQFVQAAEAWRSTIVDGGSLVVALRVPHVSGFVGVIQAASMCGWKPELEKGFRVRVGDESFPVLSFSARTEYKMDQKDIEAAARIWDELPRLSIPTSHSASFS